MYDRLLLFPTNESYSLLIVTAFLPVIAGEMTYLRAISGKHRTNKRKKLKRPGNTWKPYCNMQENTVAA